MCHAGAGTSLLVPARLLVRVELGNPADVADEHLPTIGDAGRRWTRWGMIHLLTTSTASGRFVSAIVH